MPVKLERSRDERCPENETTENTVSACVVLARVAGQDTWLAPERRLHVSADPSDDERHTPHAQGPPHRFAMFAVRGIATLRPAAREVSASATARPRLARRSIARRTSTPLVASHVSSRVVPATRWHATGHASRRVSVRASGDDDKRSPFDTPRPKRIASPRFSQEAQTWALLGGVATSLTVLVTLAVVANDEAAYFGGSFEGDFGYMGDDYTGGGSNGLSGYASNISIGSILASVIWSFGLFFKSPLQILLVFLGRTDTERPSDWIQRALGASSRVTDAGSVVDVEGDDEPRNEKEPGTRGARTFEEATPAAQIATLLFFAACGSATVASFDWAFAGEDAWGLSAGIGFTMISFVAELGSPQRYSKAELDILETQYADFLTFAEENLERSGRCHASEVSRAFRRKFAAKYTRSAATSESARDLSEKDLYAMILNWHPSAERTSHGFFKNLSLKEGVDQRSTVTVKDLGL